MKIISRLRGEFSFIKGNYAILVLSWILMDFAGEIPAAYASLYILALGATPVILGVIGLTSALALAAVQFPGGYLADKHGRRWLVSTMTFGVALSYLFYALAPSWHMILIGAVVGNLCLIYQPALMAMLADSLPSEKRGMGFSIITLITRVATTPAPALAAFLVYTYDMVPGMRIGYSIVVALFLTAAILRSRLRETVGPGGSIRRREFLTSYPTAIKESIAVWKMVPRSTFYLFLVNILGTFGFSLVMLLFNVYAVDTPENVSVLHLNTTEWGVLLTFLFLALIVAAIPCGKFIDKAGRKIPILVAYALSVPTMLLFIYGNFQRLLIAMPLMGVWQILMFSGFSALQADLVPKEKRGKVIGFSRFVECIVMGGGQILGTYLYQNISMQLPFFILLALTAPQVILMLFFVHEPKERES